MKFQYLTTFFPVEYPIVERGRWIFKGSSLPHTPEESSLYANPEYQEQMRFMGEEGWELISVQPLLEGVYAFPKSIGAIAYSVTAGYYFFWKRVIE
jgi:hypothetical protein